MLETALSSEQIIGRLMQIDRRICIRMRDRYSPGLGQWYVDMGQVMLSVEGGGLCSCGTGGGDSPDEAIQKAWSFVFKGSVPPHFFIRHNCELGENVPGEGPQVWFRWDKKNDGWKDVVPTAEMLNARQVPLDRIRSISAQIICDRQ